MPVFPKGHLLNLSKVMLIAAGLPKQDAVQGAEVLIQSDLSGVESHGLARLPMYLGRIAQGVVNVRPKVKLIGESSSSMVLDCDNGLGIVTVPGIMDRCLKKAKESGMVAATMRHSNHYGVGNYYALKGISENMISILMTNTTPCMAPTGGIELLIGTNPITIGIPAGKERPIILDMASSNVAMGKLQAMFMEKQKIPFGWAITKDGRPTDDPAEALEGSLLPIAGYKGYGLAVIVDMLSAVLAGAAFGLNIGRLDRAKKPEPEGIGHFLLILDPARFRDLAEFKATVDTYIRTMKQSSKADGTAEIFLPGEIELGKMEIREKAGLPVSEALAKQLLNQARNLKLASENDDFKTLVQNTSSL